MSIELCNSTISSSESHNQKNFDPKIHKIMDSLSLELQNILNPQWEVTFFEALSRFWKEYWNIWEIIAIFKEHNATYFWFLSVVEKIKQELELTTYMWSRISVNVFPSDLAQPNFVKDLCDRTVWIPKENIIVEIIEEGFKKTDKEQILNNLRVLQWIGVNIAIDDIIPQVLCDKYKIEQNNWEQNLTELITNALDPDMIKIDGQIIRKIIESKITNDEDFRKYINKWSGNHEVVAEWIRSYEEAKFWEENYGIVNYQWRDISPEDFKKVA